MPMLQMRTLRLEGVSNSSQGPNTMGRKGDSSSGLCNRLGRPQHPPSGRDRLHRWKISEDTVVLNSIINPLSLIAVHRTPRPTTEHQNLTKKDHGLHQNTHPNTFKRTETIQHMFSDHIDRELDETELEISNRKTAGNLQIFGD